MSQKIIIKFDPEPSPIDKSVDCRIDFDDPDMIDCEAMLDVVTTVEVKDSRPINRYQTALSKKFKITNPKLEFPIPANTINSYSYFGTSINIRTKLNIVINDSIFRDSKKSETITKQILKKPDIAHKHGALVNPQDKSSFLNNLKSIPKANRHAIFKAILIGSISIFSFLFFAIHDLWNEDVFAYIYTLFFLDPAERFLLIIFVTFIGIAISYSITRRIIHKNMSNWLQVSLNKNKFPKQFPLDGQCKVSDLIQGKTTIQVNTMKIRIIVCNLECGQYTRGSGTSVRIVSFTGPVREFILFEKTLHDIPKGMKIGNYLNNSIYYKDIYKHLFPRNKLTNSHGIDLYWEVQFLHEQFIDHEIILPTNLFINAEFYK